jgi:opacity protein-like surface antigen
LTRGAEKGASEGNSRDVDRILNYKNSINVPRISLTGPFSVVLLAALLSLACAGPSFAQQSFGLKFAYPTTDAFQVTGPNTFRSFTFHSRPPKFGVTGELNLPANLLLEIDALYSRLSYSSTQTAIDAITSTTTTVNCWNFPILVKKEFLPGRIKPFIVAGPAFQAVNADAEVTTKLVAGTVMVNNTQPPEFIHQATIGYAVGAGLDLKFGRFHILPEYRYMRFQNENFRSLDGSFQSNLKQPVFMVGIQRGR